MNDSTIDCICKCTIAQKNIYGKNSVMCCEKYNKNAVYSQKKCAKYHMTY